MIKPKCVLCLTLLVVSASLAAEEYNYFAGVRYPGPGNAPGVDIYKVDQAGGPRAAGYRRRVVDWWPRKGVDIIEVKDAMIQRTWTLREKKLDPEALGKHLVLGVETLTKRTRYGIPRRFTARLVGFRGIGNRYGNPFEPGGFYCPAVVLLMNNGDKRCFARGTFVEADEKFILELYLREIEKLRKSLSGEEYPVDKGLDKSWPNNAKPGRPGTMRVESDHFVWVSGSQHAPNEQYSPWVNRDEPEKALLYRLGSVAFAEDMWAYYEYAGALMPYWDRKTRRKYAITVCGTYRDGNRWLGGYAGGGYGGCGIKYAGGGPWALTLAHEWGHGIALQVKVDGGGGETLSDACSAVVDPASQTYYNNAKRPWRSCFHGSYGTGLFYAVMGQDPNWGYAMAMTMPVGANEASVFHTLARIGEQRGLFENGIRGAGDMMGEFAARQAEFDCEIQEILRRDYISVKRNHLEAVDRKAGVYRIPWEQAPEAFGANIIRLIPEKGARKIAVDFRGFHDPATYGDWRACIVVAGADGRVRYSNLWNKGLMEMAIEPTDKRFWLTAAATPIALPKGRFRSMVNGRHAFRYPYEVTLTACRPGTPHNLPSDVEDYGLAYMGGWRDRFSGGVCMIPEPGDSPHAAVLAKAVAPMRKEVDQVKQAAERAVAEDMIDTKHWRYLRRFRPHLAFLDDCVNWMIDGTKGRRHPNGGGWVSASCQVASTAYVAPDAMVLYGAKVLDRAAIEDYAVVKGPKTVVSGRAKVSGQACVSGDVRIGGFTRVVHPIISDEDTITPNEVPLRPYQDKDDGEKLWANYSMDRDESEVFEDWFRYRDNGRSGGFFYGLNLNGHLYGKPKFFVEGDRRGFAFDGKTQYAEAAPGLADLGQITVDVALKHAGGVDQAVFDFGTSRDNRFILTGSGASGKAELAITLQGETQRIIADAPLPVGKWARCRVEIDGKGIALWIDDRKAAEQASSFRPADVYPPGVEKRDFVAAARNAERFFKGSIDYLRVYYAVYDDFAKAPEPRRHASRRPTREFIETNSKKFEGVEERRNAKIDARFKPQYAFYEQMGRRRGELLREIESSGSKEAGKRKTDQYKPEYDWLTSLGWIAFSGHYNYPYRRYLRDKIAKDIGGKVCHENFGSLNWRISAREEGYWSARCDWDWRLKQEIDGSIKDLPLLRKWLKRIRGNPVIGKEINK